MKKISMDLITTVKELKEKTGISTKLALSILIDTGVYRAKELPNVETMDAILRGLKTKNKKEKKMFKRTKTKNFFEDIVQVMEEDLGFGFPEEPRKRIIAELEVSHKLNGEISQNYIDNLKKVYRYAYKNAEAPTLETSAQI